MSKSDDAAGRRREIVRRQAGGGFSAAAFSRRSQIPQASFYVWQRKLQDAVALADVRISPDPVRATGALEQILPEGRSIVIRLGFDRATLLALIDALERGRADRRRAGVRRVIRLPSLAQLDRATRTRIWLCTGPTDMRRGFDRLSEQAQQITREHPQSGHRPPFAQQRSAQSDLLGQGRFCPMVQAARGARSSCRGSRRNKHRSSRRLANWPRFSTASTYLASSV